MRPMSGSLAVACWHARLILARFASKQPNIPNVSFGFDLQLGLAIPGHIRVAGGAFLLISLAHRSNGRRLRRKLLSEC